MGCDRAGLLDLAFEHINPKQILRPRAEAKQREKSLSRGAANIQNPLLCQGKVTVAAKQIQHLSLSLLLCEEIAGHPSAVFGLLPTILVPRVDIADPSSLLRGRDAGLVLL